MGILIAGLVIFLGVHSLPMFPAVRNSLVASMGEGSWKGTFSIISLVGLVLIFVGYGRAPFQPVYPPVDGAYHIAYTFMPLAFILLAAANMPGHLRAKLKHPMLIAVLLWAAVHLAANGDLRAIILFGGFAAYALLDLISEVVRGKTLIDERPPQIKYDFMAVGGGLIVFAIIMYFHGNLFGIHVVPRLF